MVDIHCHILPEVDDGAEDLAEALEMARIAAESGVTDLAATSHFRGDLLEKKILEEFRCRFRELEAALRREEIPLRLHLGAEVLCSWDTLDLAQEGGLPTLGDTRYVLCEFRFDAPWGYMDEILDGIRELGYRPVVAHPERYGCVQQDPRRAGRWFQKGYVIQLNKGSVLGSFGSRPQETARLLLERGFVHMIASDAHSAHRRNTDMGPLAGWLLERYPRDYVRLLLTENPGRLLRGEGMAPVR